MARRPVFSLLPQHRTIILGVGVDILAEFVYDGDGNRLQQIDHTGSQPFVTTYTNDIMGVSQVLVSSNGITTTYNLFGLDLISQDDGTERRFMLADGLGSVRVEMVGNVVETTTTYEPYGRLLAQTGATGTVYGFTGEEYDTLTSLVYLRARYYNPSLKLFLSRDPFPGIPTMPASQHGYSYVYNNSVNKTDPSGMCEQWSPDESCWGIYETILLEFPQANSLLYYYDLEYRKLAELPAVRLQNILRELRLIRPYKYYNTIQLEAARYGIPTEILFGVLDAEMHLDTDASDLLGDSLLSFIPFSAEYVNVGPGIGNIHLPTLRGTGAYYLERYGSCNQMTYYLGLSPNESATSLEGFAIKKGV